MDPVSLVVAALVAGAAAGVAGTASSVVSDAYAGLKNLVRGRIAARQIGAETVLDRATVSPPTWEAELVPVLTAAEVGQDEHVRAAAQQLLRLVDPSGWAAGKYVVDLRDAMGVQVGDHNTQHNTFS